MSSLRHKSASAASSHLQFEDLLLDLLSLGDKSALAPLRKIMKDIADDKAKTPDESGIQARLEKKGTYPYGFIHFPELIDRFSADSGIELRINDEVLYGIYVNAQDPDNLDSVKIKFYHTPTGEAVKKIAGSTGSYYYIESGTVNIASKSYVNFDTDLEFEAAAALYLLGDKSWEKSISRYRNVKIYRQRVKALLR